MEAKGAGESVREGTSSIELGYVEDFMENWDSWERRAVEWEGRMSGSRLGRLGGFIKQSVKQDIHSHRND